MGKGKLTANQKIRIVKEYLEGGIGRTSLARKYGISEWAVRNYITIYEEQGAAGFINNKQNKVTHGG